VSWQKIRRADIDNVNLRRQGRFKFLAGASRANHLAGGQHILVNVHRERPFRTGQVDVDRAV
jgi:hypothetical protein